MTDLFLISVLSLVALSNADMYMQNPRGSNDRLNEANTNRDNANRLFDSQNNAQGGYCYGPPMAFYEGSMLSIQWTNQHGCGINPKEYCNVVIQYMCGSSNDPPESLIRDGTTTDTIPNSIEGTTAVDGNNNLLYGMHESYQYYQDCSNRERNMGLFIADREEQGGLTPNLRDARFTRQNNNGDQYGFECPEERDYYPYWAPSPWRDIAILTDMPDKCDFYQSESQNVKNKGYCINSTSGLGGTENNAGSCNSVGGQSWTTGGSWGFSPPTCLMAPWTRENHLGNTDHWVITPEFNWTLPTSNEESCISNNDCNCVLRLRYNISTGDLGPNGNNPQYGFIDWTSNGAASPVQENQIMEQDGISYELAIDTTQFGRGFQDRSYVFNIIPRPSGISSTSRIYNLNVRGKRGDIVQVYPATEYDYVPQFLHAHVNDYIHFQWTGCDTNPAGNAGEGTDQTDRSNIIQVEAPDRNQPASDEWISANGALFESQELRVWMGNLGQQNCLNYSELLAKNDGSAGDVEQDPQNCMKLNAASAYFNGGLIRMNTTGNYYFFGTRNNQFSNRDQKGVILIDPLLPIWAIVIVSIGSIVFLGSGGIAGAMFYAKSHPHSKVAEFFTRLS